jgi:uncharacterized Tic20 family protein
MEELRFDENGRIIIPQPTEIPDKEKDDAMGAYLMVFAAWGIGLPLPFLSLIAAIIYYYINRKISRFVGFHSFQALLLEIPISIMNAAFIVWIVILVAASGSEGFSWVFFSVLFFLIICNILFVVFSCIGAYKAKKGSFYYIIFLGRMAFDSFYGKRAQAKLETRQENKPPSGY